MVELSLDEFTLDELALEELTEGGLTEEAALDPYVSPELVLDGLARDRP